VLRPNCTDCNFAEAGIQESELNLNEKQKSESRKKVAGPEAPVREMGVERQIDGHTRSAREFGWPLVKVGVRSCVCQTLLRLLANRIEVVHW